MRRIVLLGVLGLASLGWMGCAERQAAMSDGAADTASAESGGSDGWTSYPGAEPDTSEPPPAADHASSGADSDAVYDESPAAGADGADATVTRDAPPEPAARRIQSGTLTAGSFDDVANVDEIKSFLSSSMQTDRDEKLPRVAIGEPVVIQVVDQQSHPIGGAKVEVIDPQRGESTLLTTASDGRAMFMSATDGRGGATFDVSVRAPGEDRAVDHKFELGQSPWQITLADVESELPTRLDLALVIDTTGSMSDELEYLKVEIDSIAASIAEMFPNVDQRYALIVYRDQGDDYVYRTFDFTGDLQEFRGELSKQSANGGGDYPEAMHAAVASAAKLNWREGNVARVMFLVADAPPHAGHAQATVDAVHELRSTGVRMYPIAASGVGREAEFLMRSAAFATMGQYLFLTDHSGVGNPHAKPHVSEYNVERLGRLMIRMIASELAAERLSATEVLAIERGDTGVDAPVVNHPPVNQTSATPPLRRQGTKRSPAIKAIRSISGGVIRHSWVAIVVVAIACGLIFDAVAQRRT